MAFVADMEVVKENAPQRNPELKSRVNATQSSAAEGVDAAIPGCVAEERDRVLGQDYRWRRKDCMKTWRGMLKSRS